MDQEHDTPVEAVEPTETPAEEIKTEPAEDAPADEPKAEGEEKKDEPKKPKEWWEKELERKQRRIDNLTKRLYQAAPLAQDSIKAHNPPDQDDSDELRLSRSELQKLIDQRAAEVAPTIAKQQAEIESRRRVVEKLSQSWGQEKFDALAADLDDALGGLADRRGQPKPVALALFRAKEPAALIEHLADPENAADAEALASLSDPVDIGFAVAELSSRIAAKKAEEKPQRSKAPQPVEPIRAAAAVTAMPSDSDPIDVWVRKERKRLASSRN